MSRPTDFSEWREASKEGLAPFNALDRERLAFEAGALCEGLKQILQRGDDHAKQNDLIDEIATDMLTPDRVGGDPPPRPSHLWPRFRAWAEKPSKKPFVVTSQERR